MFKIQGVNGLGLILGALGVWLLGSIWYGMILQDAWLDARGYTNEQVQAAMQPMLFILGGGLIALVLSFAQGRAMVAFSRTSLVEAAILGLGIGVSIGLPITAYNLVYSVEHSWPLFFIDGGYVVTGFVLMGVIHSFFASAD